MRGVSLCIVAGIGCGSSAARPNEQLALEAYLSEQRVVGVAAAAVTSDEILWTHVAGFADRERGVPVTPQSIFLVASITKAVLAVAALGLVEDGRLELDVTIDQYLPFRVANPAHPLTPITARQLLAHVSSISDLHYLRNASTFYTVGVDPTISLGELCVGFFAPGGAWVDPDTFGEAAPGGAYEYSNLGFALLGCVIERAAGEPLPEYLRRRVLGPLGMTRSSVRLAELPVDGLVMPYGPGSVPAGHYTFADYPNGGLRTSIEDLSAVLRMVMAGGVLDGTRVLTTASTAELLRVQYPELVDAGDQALGWDVRAVGERSLLGHAGGELGVAGAMYFDPGADLGVIVLSNRGLDEHVAGFAAVFEKLVALVDAR
jgi:CubicO group peptidase (beta-lactamase class C family)